MTDILEFDHYIYRRWLHQYQWTFTHGSVWCENKKLMIPEGFYFVDDPTVADIIIGTCLIGSMLHKRVEVYDGQIYWLQRGQEALPVTVRSNLNV